MVKINIPTWIREERGVFQSVVIEVNRLYWTEITKILLPRRFCFCPSSCVFCCLWHFLLHSFLAQIHWSKIWSGSRRHTPSLKTHSLYILHVLMQVWFMKTALRIEQPKDLQTSTKIYLANTPSKILLGTGFLIPVIFRCQWTLTTHSQPAITISHAF